MQLLKYLSVVLAFMQSQEIMSMSSTRSKLGLNIKNLKGSHEILKDYPGYEPFWGLVFAEKDVAKNLYTFSMHQIKKEADVVVKAASVEFDPFKKSVEEYLKDKQNTATQNLVRQMFNEVGGTFNATNALNNPVMQFKPEHLGKILRLVHDAKNYDDALVKIIEDYLVGLKLKDPANKDFKAKDFRPFAKNLVGAAQECSAQNPDALFAQNTAQGIVLGYLLWKSNNRADLERYFSGFLGKDLTLPDEQFSEQDFVNILRADLNLQNPQQFADFVCAAVYKEKYASAFPKMITCQMVQYKGFSFPACVDSSIILNLANIITYSQEKARLGIVPEGLTMNEALAKFYAEHGDPASVHNNDVNQAWTDVVQNIQGCAYNRLGDSEAKTFLTVSPLSEGVIPIDTVDATLSAKTVTIGSKDFVVYEKQVGDQNYWLVPKDSGLVCCELMPTASNIIVLMNRLFNLQLYELIDAIFNPDFVQTYFAKMCEKFGWRTEEKVGSKIVIQTFDRKQFTIHLHHKAHGYISINEASSFANIANRQHAVDALDHKAQAACIALGLGGNLNFDINNAFYYKLLNPNLRLEIIKGCMVVNSAKNAQITDSLILSFYSQEDGHFQNTLMTTYEKQPLKCIKIMLKLSSLKYNNKLQLVCEMYYKYFCDAAHVNEILALIKLGMNQKKATGSGLRLVGDCVYKGLLDESNRADIVAWITLGMSSERVMSWALSLAMLCVKKEGLLDESNCADIVAWIKLGMNNEDEMERALSLAQICVKKDLLDKSNRKDIAQWINKGMTHGSVNLALLLATACIYKGLLGISYAQELVSWVKVGLNSDKIDPVISLIVAVKDLNDKDLFEEVKSLVKNKINGCYYNYSKHSMLDGIRIGLFDDDQNGLEKFAWHILQQESLIRDISTDSYYLKNLLYFINLIIEKNYVGASFFEVLSGHIKELIEVGRNSLDESIRFEAKKLKTLIDAKGWLNNPRMQEKGGMMEFATSKGMLSQTQVNRMRAGLPKDMQPLSPEQLAEVELELAQEEQFAQRQVGQEQFTPPTADQLAQQRESMNEFNQNWQAQQQPNLAEYQPQPVPQLPAQQVGNQPIPTLTRWKMNIQNALRGGARSVPRL